MTPEEIKQLAERIDVRRGKVPSWRDWLAALDVIELQQQEIAELRAEQRHHVEELRRDVLGETHEKLARAVEDLGRLNNENVKLQQEIADLYATSDHDNELVGKYMAAAERLAKENEGLKQEIANLQRAIIWLDENQLHIHAKVRWVFEIIAKAREVVK